MDATNKVFQSAITRTSQLQRNNLYDLLKIIPAKPLEINNVTKYSCEFKPRTDKIYIPKRRLRAKVKTVKDIRTSFENETFAFLTRDLEAQQNYLLKKISSGSSRNENTQNIARKIFESDSPISRSTWQMLVNLNPDEKTYTQQFVLWNGKYIEVTGSKGGNQKLLCNYDLANKKISKLAKNKYIKTKKYMKRSGLLKNSLAIKFKPGPLGKKKFLDDSHQKHHGDIECVDLPKVGLVVQPTYGAAIEPKISNFLSSLCKKDGIISEKWAEFAVSVLGKIDESAIKLLNEDCVTFDLKYKCDQHRILMRKDLDNLQITKSDTETSTANHNETDTEHNVTRCIEDMMDKILSAVEVNIKQDCLFTPDEDNIETTLNDSNPVTTTTLPRDKSKKKYSELDRLDVTVIRIPESAPKEPTFGCKNAYCSLGCICDSIKCPYRFKQHCGREECMFHCKCDFSKYNTTNFLELNGSESIELLPGIINIEDEINMKLAKEEQKFHQTVIVSGEKNILLKSEKRNWKSSKKYGNFYKNMCLKNVSQKKKILSISAFRLNCENVEPWCMVHNLYKCFCKGKFTASNATTVVQSITKDSTFKDVHSDVECPPEKIPKLNNPDYSKKVIPRLQRYDAVDMNQTSEFMSGKYVEKKTKTQTIPEVLEIRKKLRSASKVPEPRLNRLDNLHDNDKEEVYIKSDYSDCDSCARVVEYTGRKFSNGYYTNVNSKIQELEKNDKVLQKKMMSILNPDLPECIVLDEDQEEKVDDVDQKTPCASNLEQEVPKVITVAKNIEDSMLSAANNVKDPDIVTFLYDINEEPCANEEKPKKKLLPTENKLVEWLETNYKQYKKRIDEGIVKTSLEPPKLGKIALHSWDFILSRYRERKNLFLISKQKPYRVFMGVHTRNPFFESCMNINEIRFADLHKYPQTVKNLLINATDLRDNFCILRGLSHCWEVVGSVAKVANKDDNVEDISDNISDTSTLCHFEESPKRKFSISDSEDTNVSNLYLKQIDSHSQCQTDAESSKWFIMTVENDFHEIRFYKKGFFVKYESIVKAISVARMSGKTVRLSSQKCVDNNGPQFGIYAIPNSSEYCVFIGPYEMSDTLGIETIKSIADVGRIKRTRGFWMNTNKVDNLKVIDNPFSFMPPSDMKNNEAVPLESHFCDEKGLSDKESQEKLYSKVFGEKQQKGLSKPDSKKMIKPIKIRKTNGFYHLASNKLIKDLVVQGSQSVIIRPSLISPKNKINKRLILDSSSNQSKLTIQSNLISMSEDVQINESPQIKISSVYSQRNEDTIKNKNERGMLILKPEEINRRLMKNQLEAGATLFQETVSDTSGENSSPKSMECPLFTDQELEASATLTPCTVNQDICIISDDEEDSDVKNEESDNFKQVLIMCQNVSDLGFIWGRQKYKTHLLSFKVPGAEYSQYFNEDIAFKELNSALSKRIGASKPFGFDWKVIESLEELKTEVIPLSITNLEEIRDKQHEETEAHAVTSNSEENNSIFPVEEATPMKDSLLETEVEKKGRVEFVDDQDC